MKLSTMRGSCSSSYYKCVSLYKHFRLMTVGQIMLELPVFSKMSTRAYIVKSCLIEQPLPD